MDWVYFSCFVFICYLLGSISFAWMAGRLNNVDLREHGSGNLGATNAGRVLGNHWFFIIFFADVSKGLIPVLVAKFYAEQVMSDGLAI
ncbi:MAG: glycerol-3-phosphate acyltransferase, partial [Planctomycetes bacterium]|nr:glycerol-3-phosphate acyltransferase [Planctomycetota bacterium]